MSETHTPETDSVTRSAEETPWTPWVCAGHAKRLERERDDALKEWDIARAGWDKALEERDEARRELEELKRAAINVALDPCPVIEMCNAKIDKLIALLKEEA